MNRAEQSPRSAPETTMAYILYIGAVSSVPVAADHTALRRPAMLIFSGKLSMTEWIHGKAGGFFDIIG